MLGSGSHPRRCSRVVRRVGRRSSGRFVGRCAARLIASRPPDREGIRAPGTGAPGSIGAQGANAVRHLAWGAIPAMVPSLWCSGRRRGGCPVVGPARSGPTTGPVFRNVGSVRNDRPWSRGSGPPRPDGYPGMFRPPVLSRVRRETRLLFGAPFRCGSGALPAFCSRWAASVPFLADGGKQGSGRLVPSRSGMFRNVFRNGGWRMCRGYAATACGRSGRGVPVHVRPASRTGGCVRGGPVPRRLVVRSGSGAGAAVVCSAGWLQRRELSARLVSGLRSHREAGGIPPSVRVRAIGFVAGTDACSHRDELVLNPGDTQQVGQVDGAAGQLGTSEMLVH